MKIRSRSIICLAAVIAAPTVHAIQSPADDAPPPPRLDAAPEVRQDADAAEPAQAEEARPGFLGVRVEDVPESLAAHLNLPAGEGALVSEVTPGSPAEKAGIKTHDILLKAGDRKINGGPSVSAIVSDHKAGDELAVELLRKGEKHQLQATLDPRPAALMGGAGFGFDDAFLQDLPQDQAGRIREMIEQNLRAMRDPGGLLDDEVFQDAFRGMREQMQRLLEDPPLAEIDEPQGGFGRIQMNVGATVRLMDNEGSVEIKSVDGGKEVVVRDRANEIVWAGPWDTPQDKAAAPDDVRVRIERLNIEGFQGNGLRMQMFQER